MCEKSPNVRKFAQCAKIRPIGENSPNVRKIAQYAKNRPICENSPNLVAHPTNRSTRSEIAKSLHPSRNRFIVNGAQGVRTQDVAGGPFLILAHERQNVGHARARCHRGCDLLSKSKMPKSKMPKYKMSKYKTSKYKMAKYKTAKYKMSKSNTSKIQNAKIQNVAIQNVNIQNVKIQNVKKMLTPKMSKFQIVEIRI
jgi:hypothetical protein